MVPVFDRTEPFQEAPILLLMVPVLDATSALYMPLLTTVPALVRSSVIVPLLMMVAPKALSALAAVTTPLAVLVKVPALTASVPLSPSVPEFPVDATPAPAFWV